MKFNDFCDKFSSIKNHSIIEKEDDSMFWETALNVLFYSARDHQDRRIPRPMPADFTIALLCHRFPECIDSGDRIWSIVCDLKGVNHSSNYDPLHDASVIRELEAIRTTK